MTNFSATDAAFSGFRFIGRRPGTVLAWAATYALYQLVLGGLLVTLMGDKLIQLQALTETNRTDPEAALAMLPSVALLLLIALPLALAFWSVMNTAAFRALLGQRGGFASLRLGRAEARMAGLILIWAALSVGYAFLVIFLFALAAAPGANLIPAVKPIYYVAWAAALVAAFVYPVVRLSLSTAMTVSEGHIRIFESWGLTRGRFWSLLGAYFLCWVMLFVLVIVGMILIAVVAAGTALATGGSLDALTGMFSPDYSSLQAYFSPVRVIAALLEAPISAAALVVAAGPSAEAYRVFSGLKGAEGDATAEPAAEPSPYAVEPAPAAGTADTEPWWKTQEVQAAPAPAAEPASEPPAAPAAPEAGLHAEEAETHVPESHAQTPAEPAAEVHAEPEGHGAAEDHGSDADGHEPEEPHKPAH